MIKSPESIVDAQVRKWNYERGLLEPPHSERTAWPIITISRECGAGGTSLARLLADRTGFTLWDKRLVTAIAEATGGDESFVAMLDERRRQAIDEVILGLMKHPRQPTNIRYHRTLLSVVEALADKGGSIIVGRGANYVGDPASRLAVRVVRPIDERVARYAELEGLTMLKARRSVVNIDEERDGFVRQYFRHDVVDASAYDLTVNTGSFTLEQTADLVMAAYERKFGRRPHRPTREKEAREQDPEVSFTTDDIT